MTIGQKYDNDNPDCLLLSSLLLLLHQQQQEQHQKPIGPPKVTSQRSK